MEMAITIHKQPNCTTAPKKLYERSVCGGCITKNLKLRMNDKCKNISLLTFNSKRNVNANTTNMYQFHDNYKQSTIYFCVFFLVFASLLVGTIFQSFDLVSLFTVGFVAVRDYSV